MTYSTVSWKALLVTAALTLPTLAFAMDPAMTKDGMLVDHKGMTLYTFDKDADGKSMCNDQCAMNWPPLKAESTDKPMGGVGDICGDCVGLRVAVSAISCGDCTDAFASKPAPTF